MDRMEYQISEKKSPDKTNGANESAGQKVSVIVDSIEIKHEPDIKLEPEDDVDTIEYTVRSPQLTKIFAPKVEKVEPKDDEGDNEVDKTWSSLDQFGHLGSYNYKTKTKQSSVNGIKPTSSKISSPNVAQTSERSIPLKDRSDKCGSSNGIKKRPAKKLHKTTTKANDANSSIEKSKKKRPALLKEKKQHKCSECGYVTPSPSKLIRHMRKHTGEKPFPCNHCPKRFTSKQSLKFHLKVHVTKNSLNCSNCWQIFATKNELVDHESTCKQRRYECYLCKKFTTIMISNLKEHMRVHSGDRPFKCDKCLMKFTRKDYLEKHIKNHINPRPLKFRCSVCVRSFLKETERDGHEINCKRRRYECYLCKCYMTNYKAHLQWHIRLHHTGEKPFKCSLCDRCYADAFNLNHHMKRSHKQ